MINRFVSCCSVLLVYCLMTSACKPQSDSVLFFKGICDGSAAVRLGRHQLLVAYDESNSLYQFNADGGEFTRSVALQNVLQLQDDRELDLEGAVAHDEGVWWIGSNGLDGDAGSAPNRRLLFKTGMPDERGVVLQSGPFDLSALLASAVTEDATELAPKEGGINVEGMSITVSGDLLIALRSPLSDGLKGNAIILQVKKVSDGERESFELVKRYQLTLGDRGIRDIVISDDGYLLIAGDVSGGGEFAVYRWRLNGELEQMFVAPDDFNAEALVDLGAYWLLLSDDGKRTRDDDESADGDRICDNIVRKNSLGNSHDSVYFRGIRFTEQAYRAD